jgi:halocyanin-like protein
VAVRDPSYGALGRRARRRRPHRFTTSNGNGGAGDGGVSVDDYPAVDEWLTETELGGAADNYDGSIDDQRDQDSITVAVGAEGNGGNFAFAPAAVAVSTGTEVAWEWTGEGNPHNVEALPEEQLGESDYEFRSGEAVGGSGVQYRRTTDEAGSPSITANPTSRSG